MIGDVQIHLQDGTTLTSTSDLGLAWAWAQHENSAEWGSMSRMAKGAEVAAALTAIRDALTGDIDGAVLTGSASQQAPEKTR